MVGFFLAEDVVDPGRSEGLRAEEVGLPLGVFLLVRIREERRGVVTRFWPSPSGIIATAFVGLSSRAQTG